MIDENAGGKIVFSWTFKRWTTFSNVGNVWKTFFRQPWSELSTGNWTHVGQFITLNKNYIWKKILMFSEKNYIIKKFSYFRMEPDLAKYPNFLRPMKMFLYFPEKALQMLLGLFRKILKLYQKMLWMQN